MDKTFFCVGSLLGMLGIVTGAFGAHALKNKLPADLLMVYEVAVRYQMYHALALLATAWAVTRYTHAFLPAAGWLFVAGTVIFSGSLYVLSLSGIRLWGAVTPFGGLMLIAAWLLLGCGVYFSKSSPLL